MDAAFANGAYSLLVGGQTINLTLAGNVYPNTPIITASANGDATWLPDGTLLYYGGNNNPLTFLSNAMTTAGFVHLGLHIEATQGQPTGFSDFNTEFFGTKPGAQTISQTYLTPSEFIVGTTYQVHLEFNAIVNGPNALASLYGGDPAYASANAVAIYTARTQFNLFVIPEPSSWAAFVGACALAFAAWRRRAKS